MVVALTDLEPTRARTGLASALTLAGMCLLVWGVTEEAQVGLLGRHLTTLVSLAVASAAWVAWEVSRHFRPPAATTAVELVAIGIAGGTLASLAPLGLVYVGVAALAATLTWRLSVAMWVAVLSLAALGLALQLAGKDLTLLGSGVAAVVAGLAIGTSRIESARALDRAARVRVAEAEAEAERARAELLAGRNHMARELHDVLAHTLSALSLRLEALDTVMSASGSSAELREQLAVTKQLVHAGLQDARGAVHALREDVPPLDRQLEKLATESGATLRVAGLPRQLGPDISLALHRAAQEGLTNVVKHAPGASTLIELDFNDRTVALSVTNGPPTGPPSPISGTGGGYGLQGIKERLLLVGGRAEAGPIGDGWRLVAEAPA